jgi:hypothetical protein
MRAEKKLRREIANNASARLEDSLGRFQPARCKPVPNRPRQREIVVDCGSILRFMNLSVNQVREESVPEVVGTPPCSYSLAFSFFDNCCFHRMFKSPKRRLRETKRGSKYGRRS